MKLHHSSNSPFVRKCLVTAAELGLSDQLERVACAASPVTRDRDIIASNPLGQVPTLTTDDGQVLYDSRVICEYLNNLAGGSLYPQDLRQRWTALTDQSLADGILDAALLVRYETTLRPEQYRWADWITGQLDKFTTALTHFETRVSGFGGRVDIGTITLACALRYLDLRYPDLQWQAQYPRLTAWYQVYSQRPACQVI
jgi:glutathione S-transferase